MQQWLASSSDYGSWQPKSQNVRDADGKIRKHIQVLFVLARFFNGGWADDGQANWPDMIRVTWSRAPTPPLHKQADLCGLRAIKPNHFLNFVTNRLGACISYSSPSPGTTAMNEVDSTDNYATLFCSHDMPTENRGMQQILAPDADGQKCGQSHR